MSHDVLKWNLIHSELNIVSFRQSDPRLGQHFDEYIAIAEDLIYFALQSAQNDVSDIQPKQLDYRHGAVHQELAWLVSYHRHEQGGGDR